MKVKTNELIDLALDWAVSKCEELLGPDGIRLSDEYCDSLRHDQDGDFTNDWSQGGPIIEREWLQITPWPNESDEDLRWHCVQHDTPVQCHAYGPTPLIAAMRCYVASKLGDTVDVPEELI